MAVFNNIFVFRTQYAGRVLIMALRSLWSQKLRSGLSVLGIVCGVIAVLVMVSIGEGGKRKVIRQIERLGITNIYLKPVQLTRAQLIKARQNLSPGLGPWDMTRIRQGCPGVREIAALKEISASVIGMPKDITPQIVAVSSTYTRVLNLRLLAGRFIAPQDTDRHHLVCVLGHAVAAGLGEDGRIGAFLRIQDQLLQIVGILDPLKTGKAAEVTTALIRDYNAMVLIPLGLEVFLTGGPPAGPGSHAALSEIIVQMQTAGQVSGARAVIQRILSRVHHQMEDFQIIIPRELLTQAQQARKTLNLILGVIAGVSLVVGGIGIMNIMLASVTERTREIGIRRAVGASRADIVCQFLAEAVILTFMGGIMGVVCALVIIWGFSWCFQWEMAVSLWAVMLPLFTAVAVGLFFGLYPAYQAAMLDPIAALRHE